MVKRTTVSVPRKVTPSANKSASTAERTASAGPLARGAPGGVPKVTSGGPTTKAPGQGFGPSLVGQDNEVGSAVPRRMLVTHMVRRAGQSDKTLPARTLVDYSKSFGR